MSPPLQLRIIPPQERRAARHPTGSLPDVDQALTASRVLAPPLDRVTFALHGVVTQSLARRVERRLRQLTGVIDARVDELSGRLVVRLFPEQISASFITALLDDEQLTAVPLEEADPARTRRDAAHTAGRLAVATRRSVALLALAGISALVLALDGSFNEQARAVALNAQALLAAAMVGWGARPTLTRATRRLFSGRPTPDTLPLLLGVGVFAASVGLFFTGGEPAFFASMLILTTTIVGDWLGHTLRRRARAPLLEVRAAIDTEAVVAQPGGFYTVRPQDLSVGDTTVVRAGQIVAADGMITAGSGHVVDPAFGGAPPEPIGAGPGHYVAAGARVVAGAVAVSVTASNPRSAVARIADVVEVVGEHRARRGGGRPSHDQRWFEARTAWAIVSVTLAILGAAGAAFILVSGAPSLVSGPLGAALAVIAAGAPLAAARLWDPALLCAVAAGLKHGALLRDLRAAYRLSKLRRLYIDRTGTLTEGVPTVQGWCVAPDTDREMVLGLVVALEDRQRHPVAAALSAFASGKLEDVNTAPGLKQVQAVPGRGIRARFKGKQGGYARLGSLAFMRQEGLDVEASEGGCPIPGDGVIGRPALDSADCPQTVVYLALGDAIVARFHLLDPIRRDARQGALALRRQGLELGLFTGDSERSAAKVSEVTGIPVAIAAVDSGELEAFIAEQTRLHGDRVGAVTRVNHVGNARRAAGTSIVLGTGLAAADFDDDVAVVKPDLTTLAEAIALSRRTRWRVRTASGVLAAYTLGASAVAASGGLSMEAACVCSLLVTAGINIVTSRSV